MFAKKSWFLVPILLLFGVCGLFFLTKKDTVTLPNRVKPLKRILEQFWEPNHQTPHQDLVNFVQDLYPDSFLNSNEEFAGIRNGQFKRMDLVPMDSTHYIVADKNTPMEQVLNLNGGTYELIPEQSNKYLHRYRLSSDNRLQSAPETPFYRIQYDPTPPALLWIHQLVPPRNTTQDTLYIVWLFRKSLNANYWDFVFRNQQNIPPLLELPELTPNIFIPNIPPYADYLYRIAPDTLVEKVFSFYSEEKLWQIHHTRAHLSPISFFHYQSARELLASNRDTLWVRHTYTGAILFKIDTLQMQSPFAYRDFTLNTPATSHILDIGDRFLTNFFKLPLPFSLYYQPLYGDMLTSVWAWDSQNLKYQFCGLKSDKNKPIPPFLEKYIRKNRVLEQLGWFDICQKMPELKKEILATAKPIEKAGLEDWEQVFYELFNVSTCTINNSNSHHKTFIIKGL
jgi:hypothetical protein